MSIQCSSLAWQPAPTPDSTRCSSQEQPGQGSACGGFGGCGLPSVLPLHSPAAMHYQGRAEDGSKNLVSLPVFCLLGKCSAELLQMGLCYGFNDIVPGVTAEKQAFLPLHLTLFHAQRTLKNPEISMWFFNSGDCFLQKSCI